MVGRPSFHFGARPIFRAYLSCREGPGYYRTTHPKNASRVRVGIRLQKKKTVCQGISSDFLEEVTGLLPLENQKETDSLPSLFQPILGRDMYFTPKKKNSLQHSDL